ncbi:MAG: polysaccharide deacetylase family protein [Bacillota bacterium]
MFNTIITALLIVSTGFAGCGPDFSRPVPGAGATGLALVGCQLAVGTRHGEWLGHFASPAQRYQAYFDRHHFFTRPAEIPVVYLTFDDGPGWLTGRIIETLVAHEAPATFFWQGMSMNNGPLWRQAVSHGFVIGNHTLRHWRLVGLTYDQQVNEIIGSKTILERCTDTPVRLFRPPFAAVDTTTKRIMAEYGLVQVKLGY